MSKKTLYAAASKRMQDRDNQIEDKTQGESKQDPNDYPQVSTAQNKSNEWSSLIKDHHSELRRRTAAVGASQAWRENAKNVAALEAYSISMHELATKSWSTKNVNLHGKIRYNDRLVYAANCIKNFFANGCVNTANQCIHTEEIENSQKQTKVLSMRLPKLIALEIKSHRTKYFKEHHESMPNSEILRSVQEFCRQSFYLSKGGGSVSHAPLFVLDVGSCYNPYAEVLTEMKVDWEQLGWGVNSELSPLTLHPIVVGVDLGPAPNTNVHRCDWTEVEFSPNSHTASPLLFSESCCFDEGNASELSAWVRLADDFIETREESGSACRSVIRVRECSQHVVIFSLLLSYLPTPKLRQQCVLNAHRVLRCNGLLIVISTRTQNRRRSRDDDDGGNWIKQWCDGIESIGFHRTHQDVGAHLVGLSFRKTSLTPNVTALLSDWACIGADEI